MIKKTLSLISFTAFISILALISPAYNASAQPTDIDHAPTIEILGPNGVLEKIVDYLFVILLISAAIAITVAAFFFITAQGDPEKIKTARHMVIYILIGVLVAFSAKGLVMLIGEIARPQNNFFF